MKPIATTLVLLLISSLLSAQSLIERHFSTYLQAEENLTHVHVSGKMFELAGYLEIEADNETWSRHRNLPLA